MKIPLHCQEDSPGVSLNATQNFSPPSAQQPAVVGEEGAWLAPSLFLQAVPTAPLVYSFL